MKIVITGSLGHISKPLTQSLVAKGHHVTVISSKPERVKQIEAEGAVAAIGTMEDAVFLSATFQGADIVYLMETLDAGVNDQKVDIIAAFENIANNYVQAIKNAGVKRVIHLSSIGAHTNKGVGILAFHYNVEKIINSLPDDVFIKFMRPVGFYYNMFAFIPSIKAQGAIIQNYGGDKSEPWVSPLDIAVVISDEIDQPFEGRKVRYIASDMASPNELAIILGEAIGIPDLKWTVISDEQMTNGLLAAGLNTQMATGLAEMNANRNHHLYDDYKAHKPTLGQVKLKEFAKEFAAVYSK